MKLSTTLLLPSLVGSTFAFTLPSIVHQQRGSSSSTTTTTTSTTTSLKDIISPFADNNDDGEVATAEQPTKLEGPLDLTWENVDAVLDEMRPFLIQDGGNVKIDEIDGPVVKLQLEVSFRFFLFVFFFQGKRQKGKVVVFFFYSLKIGSSLP